MVYSQGMKNFAGLETRKTIKKISVRYIKDETLKIKD